MKPTHPKYWERVKAMQVVYGIPVDEARMYVRHDARHPMDSLCDRRCNSKNCDYWNDNNRLLNANTNEMK